MNDACLRALHRQSTGKVRFFGVRHRQSTGKRIFFSVFARAKVQEKWAFDSDHDHTYYVSMAVMCVTHGATSPTDGGYPGPLSRSVSQV